MSQQQAQLMQTFDYQSPIYVIVAQFVPQAVGTFVYER